MNSAKILIVEDEEFVRESVVDYLNMKGYENILAATTGKDAIEIIGKEKPDFVFLDIQLADKINGIEVLRQSREMSPGTKCIMMSAYKDEHGEEAMRLGAWYFLKKPIHDLDKLMKLINDGGK